MKTLFFKRSLFLLLSVLLITSCSTSDDDNSQNQESQQLIGELQNIVRSGTWKITKYIDSGEDELYHFQGYSFTFNENGTVVATNGTNTYNGTWSITDSNSSDDDSNDDDDLDFNLAFNETNEFEDLTDDWDILSRSSTKIELQDISGGSGEIDLLTFEKS